MSIIKNIGFTVLGASLSLGVYLTSQHLEQAKELAALKKANAALQAEHDRVMAKERGLVVGTSAANDTVEGEAIIGLLSAAPQPASDPASETEEVLNNLGMQYHGLGLRPAAKKAPPACTRRPCYSVTGPNE